MLGRACLTGVALAVSQADAALWGRSVDELEERLHQLCAKLAANGPLPNSAYRTACDGFLGEHSVLKDVSWFMTILMYGGTGLVIFCAIMFLRFVPPTHGRNLLYHVIYVIGAGLLLLTPLSYQELLFSPIGVSVVGVLYPALESVRAVLSVGGEDDTRWLQYWIAQGAFTMGTAWLDTLAMWHPQLFEWWWYMSFTFLLWLQLPFTDGSALLYELITEPYLVPLLKPIAQQIANNAFVSNVLSWCVNGVHLTVLYIVFILLPGHIGSFVCIMLATCYPVLASIVAVTTDDTADDTQWLTYWSVFSIIHLAINMVNDIAIWIPGFYSVMTLTVAFLLLPMTRGAETIFRKALVPICQLDQKLIEMDALRIRKEMERHGMDHTILSEKSPSLPAPQGAAVAQEANTAPTDEKAKKSE